MGVCVGVTGTTTTTYTMSNGHHNVETTLARPIRLRKTLWWPTRRRRRHHRRCSTMHTRETRRAFGQARCFSGVHVKRTKANSLEPVVVCVLICMWYAVWRIICWATTVVRMRVQSIEMLVCQRRQRWRYDAEETCGCDAATHKMRAQAHVLAQNVFSLSVCVCVCVLCAAAFTSVCECVFVTNEFNFT